MAGLRPGALALSLPDPEALIAPRLARARLIAVVTLDDAELAEPVVRALAAGGVGAVEITLRTPAGLEAIRVAAAAGTTMAVGAGTCLTVADLHAAREAGAAFAVSPGASASLMQAAAAAAIPYLPGVATPSEVMAAAACGYRTLKLFPAAPLGGPAYLAALAAPFPAVRFCPTGGVTAETAAAFLATPRVAAVGGSWLTPADALEARDWARIETLARAATARLS